MKLAEKGRHQPPPVLASREAQTLSETLAAWAQVNARTHWLLGDESTVDGADFYVGEEELGHLHLDGEAHVAVGKSLAAVLIKQGLAHRFRWSHDFVTWPVGSAAERSHAQWLFSLRYAVLQGATTDAVLARVKDRAEA